MDETATVAAASTRLRAAMGVTNKWAYFDHAAVAPISGPAAEAIRWWCEQAENEGDTLWPDWSRRLEEARRRAAGLVNADPNEIALVANTTVGVNIVAEGLPWQAGDNVVTAANEFPTNLYPWLQLQSRGVEVRQVQPRDGRIEADQVADLCDSRTRLVALSWVGYGTGFRLDPAEMATVAHDHGALFFLDAIQGLGVFPLNVRSSDIDFFAADGHKWMLGPEGAGLFYVRCELLDQLRPHGLGWNSVVGRFDFSSIDLQLRPEAARFEGGSHNMAGFLALGASLDLLAECGLGCDESAVGQRVLQLNADLSDRLAGIGAMVSSPSDADHGSGIVSFQWPDDDPHEVRQRCLRRGVALACRDGRLRASPHAYNNEEDIERLLAALSHDS